ncbi:MAG: pyruvate kinase [Candidatus Micrarchaeota archaeon]|nr:pyruvate kinase [Candidatus Micrarchaeota archaeon]
MSGFSHRTHNKTKVLCTIGPASESKEVMQKLVEAGMDGIRINTAHGDFEQYSQIIKTLREITEEIPILIDIKGPELRAKLIASPLILRKNQVIRVGFKSGTDITITYDFFDDVDLGDIILFYNGLIRTKVIKKYHENRTLDVKVMTDGTLENNKGVNVPNVTLSLPPLSDKDIKALHWCNDNDIDFVALSFTRNKKDILNVKKYLRNDIKIIAKIENLQGIKNIDEIIEYSDGVMVARGDLGAEIGIENVPIIQKKIIQKCINVGNLSITATQMLESMINNPIPTRAEVTDVATAVLDGSDCVMLSGETAMGKYPVEAVKTMVKICRRIEKEIEPKKIVDENLKKQVLKTISESVTRAIPELTKAVNASSIVALTRSGYTAIMVSRFRLNANVFAITANKKVFRQLNLYFGIKPIIMPDTLQTISHVSEYLLKHKLVNKHDTVIFSSGTFKNRSHHSNMIEVHNLGEICKNGKCTLGK